ncbi:unnamed protein product [Callosobruchus maculatus]|uniref:Uncharacterized protein n=1 Tax=Callosobruchus maculatus TaxID=64391 RepID=A0A653BP77_CALMS|nr:unnamed protein product [Callosobruchus maculatus]
MKEVYVSNKLQKLSFEKNAEVYDVYKFGLFRRNALLYERVHSPTFYVKNLDEYTIYIKKSTLSLAKIINNVHANFTIHNNFIFDLEDAY